MRVLIFSSNPWQHFLVTISGLMLQPNIVQFKLLLFFFFYPDEVSKDIKHVGLNLGKFV